jgi:hypothetical protein
LLKLENEINLSNVVPWTQIWTEFNVNRVHWNQLPKQTGRWLAMVAVVGFSSCLDVAAIEMEAATSLDYNK